MKRVIDPDNVNMVKIIEDGTKVSSDVGRGVLSVHGSMLHQWGNKRQIRR